MYSLAVSTHTGRQPAAPRATPWPHASTGNQAMLRRLQAKLTVGDVDDPLEHEADAVAEQVMRMPDPSLGLTAATPRVSRKCDTCEEEDAKKIRTKRAGTGTGAGEAPDIVHDVLGAPGRPLEAATRAFMEPRFGCDLGDIRVHTGADAATSARAVGATAYTVGRDLVFGEDQYTPGTSSGAKLLAHELTHAVQQEPERLSRQVGSARTDPNQNIKDSNTRRTGTLLFVLSELSNVLQAEKSGLQPNPYTFTVPAIQKWLHASHGDANFASTVQAALTLYQRNLALNPRIVYQADTSRGVDPAGNACPGNFAYSRGGVSPIFWCDEVIKKGPNCQRDVMIHEYFHLLGLVDSSTPAATTSLALKRPDSLAQMAAEIGDGPHLASCLGSD